MVTVFVTLIVKGFNSYAQGLATLKFAVEAELTGLKLGTVRKNAIADLSSAAVSYVLQRWKVDDIGIDYGTVKINRYKTRDFAGQGFIFLSRYL